MIYITQRTQPAASQQSRTNLNNDMPRRTWVCVYVECSRGNEEQERTETRYADLADNVARPSSQLVACLTLAY